LNAQNFVNFSLRLLFGQNKKQLLMEVKIKSGKAMKVSSSFPELFYTYKNRINMCFE